MTTEQQNAVTPSSEDANKTNNLPMVLDIASGALLMGGSIVSLITQQVAVAALPLSAAVALNMVNRRKLMTQMLDNQNAATQKVTELIYQLEGNMATNFTKLRQETESNFQSHQQTHQNDINTLTTSLDNLRQSHGNLSQNHQNFSQSHQILSQNYQDLSQSHQVLSQNHQQLQRFSDNLDTQLRKIEDVVGELRKIDNFTQSIRSNPDAADVYYQRGLSHQQLGDKEEAIADFTEAIMLKSTHAKAYHHRGILLADLGQRRKAAEDVRLAAKFYFDQGDLDSYEQARLLSKDFYAVRSNESEPELIMPDQVENMTEELDNPAVNIVTLEGIFN